MQLWKHHRSTSRTLRNQWKYAFCHGNATDLYFEHIIFIHKLLSMWKSRKPHHPRVTIEWLLKNVAGVLVQVTTKKSVFSKTSRAIGEGVYTYPKARVRNEGTGSDNEVAYNMSCLGHQKTSARIHRIVHTMQIDTQSAVSGCDGQETFA